jgi:hypothetical protein
LRCGEMRGFFLCVTHELGAEKNNDSRKCVVEKNQNIGRQTTKGQKGP